MRIMAILVCWSLLVPLSPFQAHWKSNGMWLGLVILFLFIFIFSYLYSIFWNSVPPLFHLIRMSHIRNSAPPPFHLIRMSHIRNSAPSPFHLIWMSHIRNSVPPPFHLIRMSHIWNSVLPPFHLLRISHIRNSFPSPFHLLRISHIRNSVRPNIPSPPDVSHPEFCPANVSPSPLFASLIGNLLFLNWIFELFFQLNILSIKKIHL